MVNVIFNIKVHHGGTFKHEPRMRQIEGTVNVLSNVDPNFFDWFDLEDAVLKLGYHNDLKFHLLAAVWMWTSELL